MNLSSKNKKYIDSVLEDRTLVWLYPALETGQSVCKEFFKLNEEFFNCPDYINSVPGHLLSYSINKQIIEQGKLPLFPFKIHKEIINNRNSYAIPFMRKDNITISLLRCQKRFKIDDCDKKYLKLKCSTNKKLDPQIPLFIDEYQDNKIEPLHGVLLYSMAKGFEGISFADIVFFDDTLTHNYYFINLLEKLHVYESASSTKENRKNLLDPKDIIKDFKKESEV